MRLAIPDTQPANTISVITLTEPAKRDGGAEKAQRECHPSDDPLTTHRGDEPKHVKKESGESSREP